MARFDKIEGRRLKYLTRDAMLEQAGPPYVVTIANFATVILLVTFLVGAHFVHVTTSTTATGEVLTTGDEQVVQHFEGGIVKSVNVRDGDFVRQGDVLLHFEPVLREAELDQVRARRAALKIRAARLKALIDNTLPDFGDLAQDFPDLVSEAMFTLNAQRDRIEGQKAVIETRISQREQSVEIYERQAVSLAEQRKLLNEAVGMRQKLFNSGHGSRVNLINAKLELSRVDGQIKEAQASADQARIGITEAQSQLAELLVTEKGTALEELTQVSAELAEVEESVTRLEDRFNRLEVVAPVDGVVHGLEVNTRGAVIEPAQVLMKIVPRDEAMIVEARIDPQDIGHVRIGQLTKVTVSGFDARRYGTLEGTLTQLSANSLTDPEGNVYFKGVIELESQKVQGPEGEHQLVPGMTVQNDVITGEHSLLSYLTGPVHNALADAFSER